MGDGYARAERVRVDLLENGEGFGACLEKSNAMAERRGFGAMHARCLLICLHCIAPLAVHVLCKCSTVFRGSFTCMPWNSWKLIFVVRNSDLQINPQKMQVLELLLTIKDKPTSRQKLPKSDFLFVAF